MKYDAERFADMSEEELINLSDEEFLIYPIHEESSQNYEEAYKNSNEENVSIITDGMLSYFTAYFKLGISAHSGVFNNFTAYIKYRNDNFIELMYGYLQTAHDNFNKALAISEKYSEMNDITDNLNEIIKSIGMVENGSYTAVEIGNLLEPNQDIFEEILDEVKRISNY